VGDTGGVLPTCFRLGVASGLVMPVADFINRYFAVPLRSSGVIELVVDSIGLSTAPEGEWEGRAEALRKHTHEGILAHAKKRRSHKL
jgi:hypothetical protein